MTWKQLLNSLAIPILEVKAFCSRQYARMLKCGCYELKGRELVFFKNRFSFESIPTAEIQTWWVDREKIHDVVHIRLSSGRVVDWLDMDYGLVPLLDRTHPRYHDQGSIESSGLKP